MSSSKTRPEADPRVCASGSYSMIGSNSQADTRRTRRGVSPPTPCVIVSVTYTDAHRAALHRPCPDTLRRVGDRLRPEPAAASIAIPHHHSDAEVTPVRGPAASRAVYRESAHDVPVWAGFRGRAHQLNGTIRHRRPGPRGRRSVSRDVGLVDYLGDLPQQHRVVIS